MNIAEAAAITARRNCSQEVVALLNYMLSHNEHHAQELDQMAENLQKLEWKMQLRRLKKEWQIFRKEICALDWL